MSEKTGKDVEMTDADMEKQKKKKEEEEEEARKKKQQQKKKKKGQKGKDGEPAEEEEELSEEDLRLKEDIALLVQRVQDSDPGVQALALDRIIAEIRAATASMTSVPKPLKFLRPHFADLSKLFGAGKPEAGPSRHKLADVLSVLAMTMDEGMRDSLTFKLQGTVDDLESWGHDFVRNLAGEVASEHARRAADAAAKGTAVSEDDLLGLVAQIVPFHMKHNAEPDAVDLLVELGRISDIVAHVDYSSQPKYNRVIAYLKACAEYFPEPDNSKLRRAALDVCRGAKEHAHALALALGLCDMGLAKTVFAECGSAAMRRQLAFLLARHGAVGAAELASTAAAAGGADAAECEALASIASNQKLSELFLAAAADLGITEPRDPEELLRPPSSSHGVPPPTASGGSGVDSARQNLALTFVNAFANCGFGARDALIAREGSKWLFKHKDYGMMSAAASLGLTMLWDVEALSTIDKYVYSNEPFVRAGALLAIGAVNATVRSEVDPALALIQEHLAAAAASPTRDSCVRVGGLLGLGLAYAGTARQDLAEALLPTLEDSTLGAEIQATAALALGLVFAGSCKGEVLEPLIAVLMDASDATLASTHARFMCLALGLIVLGRGDASDVAAEMAKTLRAPASEYALLCINTCAYAATGNVLKVQYLLGIIVDHAKIEKDKQAEKAPAQAAAGGPAGAGGAAAAATAAKEKEKEKEKEDAGLHPQGVAVLGIALLAMGEEVGDEMVLRSLDHVLQYGDAYARRAVPLALGLLSVSHPRVGVVDTLMKLCHDSDSDVAACAVLSLGLVGSGTNNSRVAGLLQSLAAYHAQNPSLLFAVRIAQGLVHLGKGTLTLSPLHSDRSLLCLPAAAGLLVVLHACLDVKGTILGRMHYLLYCIAVTVYPRVLFTVDDTPGMQVIRTPVRVGQAVDIAGQAGRPKAITGFQTHTTPVLIAFGERAELATDDYTSLSPFLEGVVILKKTSSTAPAAASSSASTPDRERI